MTATILQRIHSLAQASDGLDADSIHNVAAQVLRQLVSDKTAPQKAHSITGVLRDLAEPEQGKVLAAIEGLGA